MPTENRPLFITLLCVALGGAALINTVGIIYAFYNFPSLRIGGTIPLIIAGIVSIYALWTMKKWGVYVYLASYFIDKITLFLFPPENMPPLEKPWMIAVIPLIFCAIVFPYWKRFDQKKESKS